MNILSLQCHNVFMFRNFHIDFTYPRKTNYAVSNNDRLFPGSKINVRKKILILGGNASGKTTFGKLLCAITNYIIGREVNIHTLNLHETLYDKEKNGSFEIDFAINDMAYRVRSVFNSKGIIEETFKRVKIFKSYNIQTLKSKLDIAPYWLTYTNKDISTSAASAVLCSKVLKMPEHENIALMLTHNVGFHYFFSNFASYSQDAVLSAPIKLLNDILPNIDNSIEKVAALSIKGDTRSTNSYVILFKNGDQLTVPDGNVLKADTFRLSHGTYEVLSFLNILEEIRARKNDIIFIDEQLAHLHAELEAYLIMKAFLMPHDSQLFFTSHNNELLDLNVPNHTFLLFKRNNDGFNSSLYVSESLTKNDRSVRNYYENDYFGVLPDYSMLDVYFEDKDNENDE